MKNYYCLNINCTDDGYHKLEAKIINIGICYGNYKEYKTDFTNFHYVILCEYKGLKFATSMHGYDPQMRPDEKFLFYH